jgi:hypothetical protein
VTAPQDPFATPEPGNPQQPVWGQPPAGQPEGYGQPPAGQWGQPGSQQPQGGTNGLAIAALVCAFLCSPLGIILGLIARGQIKKTGQGGSGLALAAIIVGCVSLVIGILVVAGGGLESSSEAAALL